MKRMIVVILAIVVIFGVSSVSVFALGLKVGLKGGVNLAKLTEPYIVYEEYSYLEDFEEYKIGLAGGAFISLNIGEALAIQPEVLFTTKGTLYEETVKDESIRLKTELDYLEIPLLLKLSLPPKKDVAKLIIFAGPAIAIKLDSKSRKEVLDEIEEKVLDNVKDNDYSLVVGAGFDLGGFIIEGRYTLGLTPIDGDEEIDIKNKVISFMIGIYF